MKTILQSITLSEAGGAQQIVKALCKGFWEENNIILATTPEGELYYWAESKGVKVYPLNDMGRSISPVKDFRTLIQLINIIKKEKPDIIHCHSWKAGVLGRTAAFLCGVEKVYFTVHGWSVLSYSNRFVRRIFIAIEKLLVHITGKLICVCETDKELGMKLKIAPESKLITICNGINDLRDSPVQSIRERHQIPGDAILIGTVARLAPQKRCLETVRIMASIMKNNPKVYFIYIGEGPLIQVMQEEVQKLGIEDKFILTGNRNDVPNYLYSMDIFLLLSNYEGLPVSILEAMSMGLPVLASDVGGVRELVQDGVNGFLLSNDEAEIQNKIETLLYNREMRESFGAKGRDTFESKYTVDKMIEGYRKMYEEEV